MEEITITQPTMSEGMYLDAMNQLKDMNEVREKELKKEMISTYGVVRLLDMIYSDQVEEPIAEVSILIETLREFLGQFVEENIIGDNHVRIQQNED